MLLRLHHLLLALLCAAAGAAATTDDVWRSYIDTYAEAAIQEQNRSGVPASITLAQGLLESAAGRSTLAREGNNHFGIKCGADWTGPTMLRDDDAPDECFRVYENARQSYADHSDFLRRRRYSSLFDLPYDDYVGWARGLSRCGYATDPNYADRLIAIIERYGLYSYDTGSLLSAEEAADFIFQNLRKTHPIRRYRDLHYVIAGPGDTYAAIAAEFSLKGADLARYNDAASPDAEIKEWEEVYLQPKHATAPAGLRSVTICEDESMHSISQRFGMTLEALRALNPKAADRSGTRLRLQF